MRALNGALGEIKFFDAKSFLVLQERGGYFSDCTADWVSLQDENLKISVSSETFSHKLSSSLVNIAVAYIKYLKNLVAIQEVLDCLENLEIRCDVILRNV
jgi:hypothetical protein